MKRFYVVLVFLLLLTATTARAQSPQCDADKSCVGNALTIDVTRGKGAQYVDVDTSSVLRALDAAMTFEAWIKPGAQPGKRQYIAGLWGPNRDNNDQWVMYIEGDRLTFALSADGSRMGDADNTIASYSIPNLYTRGWLHVAGVFDGSTTNAMLYVDGIEVARATNAQYPIRRLHKPDSRALPMQIGSCNSMFDDTTNNRAFLGQIDEIRLWNRALTPAEVRCQYHLSMAGNEPGLILYYRCNQPVTAQDLCDATGRGHIGRMRSGARCERSDRVMPATFVVSPGSVNRRLDCAGADTITFTIVDTSFCGGTVRLSIGGRDASVFRVSNNSLTLAQNVQQVFQVFVDAKIIGQISASLQVRAANACGDPVVVPLDYLRTTDLSYSKTRITLDTLFVGCEDRTFEEDTIQICNTTGSTRTIFGITLGDTAFKWRPLVSGGTPRTLAPGECWSIVVRLNTADTTRTAIDTLRVASDDACPGGGIIPLWGHSQDVIGLLTEDGRRQIKRMDFEPVCPGMISDVRLYQYRNLVSDTIRIESITPPPGFIIRRAPFPLNLRPNFAYQAEFVRFRPDRPGPFSGTIEFVVLFRGCRIRKSITVTGTGIDVNIDFKNGGIAYGNVTIGKSAVRADTARNKGADARRLSTYLKVGDVFRIVSQRSFTLAPGAGRAVDVEFRPREPRTYYDTLCLFDEQCYTDTCIPITGTGIFESLRFEPPYLAIDNVPGCDCRDSTIKIKNISGAAQTVTSVLNDGTGKFTVQPFNGTLQDGDEHTYVVRYCPNDLNDDRADVAYIDITLGNGEKYQVLLRGSSIVPRLYVTPLTTYGNVEVGWQKTERILVENVSTLPITINNPPTVPPGYTVMGTTPAMPVTLGPRDSLWIDVEFKPPAVGQYNGPITFTLDLPCRITQTGTLTGRGVIIELKVPESLVNYGLVKPCDCPVRKISLPNASEIFPITIDSIWIDGQGVSNPRPEVFTWRSQLTGATTLPYDIPAGSTDTLLISYCPNIPATQANVQNNGTLHIRARGEGWNKEFTTTLSGRRELNFRPNVSLINFKYVRVDRDTVVAIEISIPDAFSNPSGDSLIIDGITFEPDQRVFFAEPSRGRTFPMVIKRGRRDTILVHFHPRAPKPYQARLQLHTTFPCDDTDTTILVMGEGFAPSTGLQMAFDTAAVGRDTMRLTTCDTLDLPVMIDRAIPQDIIDILFRIQYDSTKLKLVGATSPYTPSVTASDTGDGARIRIKDARFVGKGTFATLRFAVIDGPSTFTIHLDQIDFDSDSLVFFKILAGTDSGTVIIDRPMIEIDSIVAFDTVNLRSCADRQVVVRNPGLVPIRFDSLANIPRGHRVTASSVPYPVVLAPGESITLTLTFCPYIEWTYDTTISAVSNWPCPIADTGRLTGVGYAPPFPLRFMFDANVGVADTITRMIADTLEIPILVDRTIPQSPLDVNFMFEYNRRALQFLGATSTYGTPTASEGPTGVQIGMTDCNNIVQGELARLRFAVAVPDSIVSLFRMDTNRIRFASDSIFWVRLVPTGDTGVMRVDPKCNITRLNFRGGANKLAMPTPSPTKGLTTIELELMEDIHARLAVYNSAGIEVARLVDEKLVGGRYRLEFDAGLLPSGAYYCILDAGRYRATTRFVVTK